MKKKLTIGSFKRLGEQGSFMHYFEHELPNGDTICLESCMEGYCVAKFNAQREILTPKVCTRIPGYMDAQIAPGFSMLNGEALDAAVKLANKLT